MKKPYYETKWYKFFDEHFYPIALGIPVAAVLIYTIVKRLFN